MVVSIKGFNLSHEPSFLQLHSSLLVGWDVKVDFLRSTKDVSKCTNYVNKSIKNEKLFKLARYHIFSGIFLFVHSNFLDRVGLMGVVRLSCNGVILNNFDNT